MAFTHRSDLVNIALIAASALAAHRYPFELLLLSYAVLGPAHYLTQISWLHDRRYFSTAPYALPALALLTLLAVFSGPHLMGVWLSLAFGLALGFVLPLTGRWRLLVIPASLLLALAAFHFGAAALFVTMLLPTLFHIFVFTSAFMLLGALRRGRGEWLALAALWLGATSFLLLPIMGDRPIHAGLDFFGPTVAYMQTLLPGSAATETRLFGFLAFAYTYHYLNWFANAEVIRWHRIPRGRLLMIVAAYGAALGLYAYDYRTGFMWLGFLSLLHVLLEFPLNLRSFGDIGREIRLKIY